jgi:hypothetical protein
VAQDCGGCRCGRPFPSGARWPASLKSCRTPLTRNQVELIQIDTTASDNLPGFGKLGISQRSLEEELEVMLKAKAMTNPNCLYRGSTSSMLDLPLDALRRLLA